MNYFGFIASAYGVSALALVGLALWVFLDARAQRRALKALEARGVRRRSAGRGAAPETTGTAQ
ncbi:heme exporter protein CcmD [Aurantimonas marianensis]|uniref:Heme exporter protein D n=1 Tax=Aurantimonas marianensis TaxID=2920428 RepID=A0A9X2HFH1_9HYPH|nr:heme exporter protein CcmD [Aurantimonas marianensis]MCP3056629.1 heme exporter protein CcmD [Aurantimonas marianensis]